MRLRLNCAACEEHGNSIEDGVTAVATLAVYCFGSELQVLVADGADQPGEVFGFECSDAHVAILSHSVQRCDGWARYHGRDEKYFSSFGWRCNCGAD
jgi:hypothetical protein